MYKEVFQKSTDGMLIIEDDKFVDCNNAVVEMLKYENKEHILNANPVDLSPEFQPDGRSSFDKVQENAKIVLEKGNKTFEWVHLRANGSPFWVEVALSDMSTDDKVRFLVVWREISEKKQLEKKNSYQNMILSSVLNSSSDLIFYKDYRDKGGKYIGCNPAFESFVGKSKKEIIGYDSIEIFGKEIGKFFRDDDLAVIQGQTETSSEHWVTYPNGERVLLHTLKSLFKDDNGNTIGIIGISRDITTAHKYKIELEKNVQKQKILANTDPLTGIMNRRAIFNSSDKLHDIKDIAVLMLDIDNFKQINDTYGHEKGDMVLKSIVDTCNNNLREEDAFGRLGGEEFIIILYNTDKAKAKEIASRLVQEVSKQKISDDKISVTVSIGMVMNDCKKYGSLSEILNDADKTLYKAKASGKNQYQLFSP
jgi:diguanylate cyclase (GGDEF)-like protein/PAS domain S-box-containing protein